MWKCMEENINASTNVHNYIIYPVTTQRYVSGTNYNLHWCNMAKAYTAQLDNKHPMGCEAQLAWKTYLSTLLGDFDS